MDITLHIPDDIGQHLASEGKDPARVALEALALEGYRTRILFESDLMRMLGFETPMQVHEFLKQNNVYLNYDLAELEKDMETSKRRRERVEANATQRAPR
jgi:hypothetical protein